MAEKINRRALESYFICQFKAYLTLSGAPRVGSDYLEMAHDQSQLLKSAIEQKLTGAQSIPERVILTPGLLSAGAPLIVNGLFEDEYFALEFDGLLRIDGASEIWSFHYAPIIFYDGQTIHLLQKQLLDTYAGVLQLLQDRKPTVGIVYTRDHTARTTTLSSDVATASHVLRHLKDIQGGAIPVLRLNDHCSICEYRQQCHAQAVKEDNLSLLRGISDTEITHLHSKGLFTVTQLSYTFKSRRTPKRAKAPSERHHFALQARAIRDQKVFIHGSPALECPGARIYLDIEGMPDNNSYYLIGLLAVGTTGEAIYTYFWSDDVTFNIQIFIDFINHFDNYDSYSLLHFGNYELQVLRKIKSQLPSSHHSKLDAIVAHSINILSIIHKHIYFPTYSNSLKEIARYLKFEWADPSSSGLQSIVWRKRWLNKGTPYKEKLLQYNRDDCAALRIVTEFIEGIISPSAMHGSPIQLQFAHASTLANDKHQSALFGKKDFALPGFSKINECAYFDYQRDRIFARSRKRLSFQQKSQRSKDLSRRINKIIEFGRSNCIHCGARKLLIIKEVTHKTIDLKITQGGIKRWITCYHAYLYRCNRCKAFFTPVGYPKGARYGPTLIAWCIYHNVRYGINLSQICSILSESFGIPLRVPILYRFKAAVARHYAARYQELLRELVRGRVLYVDETPVNLWKSKGYVWVFASTDVVYYFYRESREGSFLPDMLDGFNGVLVSDFFTAYDALGMPQQRCLIHLMRDLNDELLRHPYDAELRKFGQMFSSVMKDIVETIDRFGLKKRHLRKHKTCADQFCQWTSQMECHSDAVRKYQKRIDKYRNKLFTFLDHDDVAWNNNNAEHAMKCFARYRRFSDGRMTKKSIQDYLVILSMYQTCEYQSRNFLADLIDQGEGLGASIDDML
jgi:predicted RecB family nuclease